MAFRDAGEFEVVAFTATQIPNIEDRRYPPELSGTLYPAGIPILPEEDLEEIVASKGVDQVVFAYSDVAHEQVMHLASRVLAAGADFLLMGGDRTLIKSGLPVISVCAARTGCGKSQTSRRIASMLRDRGVAVSIIRHPMPYGDLVRQRVQRFATLADLKRHACTIEEKEEYEQYVERGMAIFAGVDYEAIVKEAEKESSLIIWDGGNNDTPFIRSDLKIVVLDPLRPGHEMKFHPGEVNLREADVVVVNKVSRADSGDLAAVLDSVKHANPSARLILADSRISVDDPALVKGKRVLVVEDGPTLTHGGMAYGAGFVAAEMFGAAEVIDPREFATGSIARAYRDYPHMGAILPALGYFPEQLEALEKTINGADCDTVVIGTPIDLRRFMKIKHPAVRVTYELAEQDGELTLDALLDEFLAPRTLA